MANYNIEVGIPPDAGLQLTTSPKVLVAAYGDGYEQRSTHGVNNIKESWNLTWSNRTAADANRIEEFFVSLKGVESFSWYPAGTEIESTTDRYAGVDTLIDTTQYFPTTLIGKQVTGLSGNAATINGVEDFYAIENAVLVLSDSSFRQTGVPYFIYPEFRYKCDKWSIKINQGHFRTITATFTKVFEL